MVRKRRSEEPKAVALALLARKAYGFPANGGCASRGDSNKFIHIVKMPVLLKDFPKIFTANDYLELSRVRADKLKDVVRFIVYTQNLSRTSTKRHQQTDLPTWLGGP